MKHYIITGTSKGLGKAICQELLKNNDVKITGLSRTNTISHKNYSHLTIDLSDINQVYNFNFNDVKLDSSVDKIILINNAGIIGDIKPVGAISNKEIFNTYQINTITPSILMNKFAEKYQFIDTEKIVLNVSSGAGRHSIESWSAYCASKSALDMFSLVFYDEQKHHKKNKAIKIYSIAPGIVDTPMQTQIRNTDKKDFPLVDKFIEYKKQNLLSSSTEIAKKIISFIENSHKYKSVLYDVREL